MIIDLSAMFGWLVLLDWIQSDKEKTITTKISVGLILVLFLGGCSTLRDSLVLGAGTGAAIGAVVGNQSRGDSGDNTIKGAVLGGVVGGIASYMIHGALVKRDRDVRRETLMNLEHYDVLGFESLDQHKDHGRSCYTPSNVDGRMVSIPCHFLDDGSQE